MERIILTKSQRARLKEKFDCSEPFISQSLMFKKTSLKQREVRSYAVNILGGFII